MTSGIIAGIAIMLTITLATTVFAVEIGDEFEIKTKSSTFSCETVEEIIDPCGKLRANFQFVVDNADEQGFTGKSKVQINIIDDGVPTKRYVLGNPSDAVPPAVLTFQNNQLVIEGKLIDRNGNEYDLLVIGDNIQQNKNKTIMDLDIQIVNPAGILFAENVQGLLPVPIVYNG